MRIDVWTDIVCPWCYIGKRRLERALEQFEHRAHVSVVWRSFELDPSAPRVFPGTSEERLMRRYGMTKPQAEQAHARVTAVAAEDGLDYRFDRVKTGNSRDAHRLVHLAATEGRADAMQERLMHGYFHEGVALYDRESLVKLASEVGLDAELARATLESDGFAQAVVADEELAAKIGIHGVPAFVTDEKYVVSGAQRPETILAALERAWGDRSA